MMTSLLLWPIRGRYRGREASTQLVGSSGRDNIELAYHLGIIFQVTRRCPMLELRALGAVELRAADGAIVRALTGQPKQLALLAYLAVAGSRSYIARSELLALFWVESDEAAARHSLSQCLYRLRRVLGADALDVLGDSRLRLAPGVVRCDVAGFEEHLAARRWRDALDLYRGELLPGLFFPGMGEFERWLDRKRQELQQAAARAAWSLAEQQLSAGAATECERSATWALALDPSNEEAVRTIMRGLAAVGAVAPALALGEKLRSTLAVEYDLQLSAESKRLINRLHDGQEATGSLPALPATADPPTTAAVVTVQADVLATLPAGRSPRARLPTARVSLVLVAALLLSGVWIARRGARASAPTRSIVVLPLTHADDPDVQYFADGLHETLIASLARISSLHVITRPSALRYGAEAQALPLTDVIVEGSVSRTGDSIRIELMLTGTRPPRPLWNRTYQAHLRNAERVIGSITENIAAHSGVSLTPEEAATLARTHDVDPVAYDLWMRASFHASRRTGPATRACIGFAEEAIRTAPEYAPAYQVLADCYNLLPWVSSYSMREANRHATTAARRALALDETAAGAHASLAYALAHYEGDWDAAEREFRRALELNSGLETAHADLGWLLAWLGRFDDALVHVRTAERLNPLSPQAALRVAMVLHLARRHDAAIASARRALEMDPAFMFAHERLYWFYRAKGMHAEALAAVQRAAELAGPDDPRRRCQVAQALAGIGRRDEARAVLDELLALPAAERVPPVCVAQVYLSLGDLEHSIDWLERSHQDGDAMGLLKEWYVYDPLRSHPRFRELIHRLNFPQDP
jgi:DNA-binding SARP family transcriptional activator/TolB-like protein